MISGRLDLTRTLFDGVSAASPARSPRVTEHEHSTARCLGSFTWGTVLLVHEQDLATEQHTGGSQPSSSDGEDDGADREEDDQCRSEGGSGEHGSESGSGEEEEEEDAAVEEESDEDGEQDNEEQGSEEALDSGSEDGEPGVSGAEGCSSPVRSSVARPAEEGSGEERSEGPSPGGTDDPTSEPVLRQSHL